MSRVSAPPSREKVQGPNLGPLCMHSAREPHLATSHPMEPAWFHRRASLHLIAQFTGQSSIEHWPVNIPHSRPVGQPGGITLISEKAVLFS